ncbi:MAG: hypothetical protein HY909_07260 [Deltaproteobacteria bacterium]|nr:hypothetical protein [Deltaproteobacteria bacterium]
MRLSSSRAPPRRGAPLFAAVLLFVRGSPSLAHGLDAHRVELVLHEATVDVVATPSVDMVPEADLDGDGRLTRGELRARREAALRALSLALTITDAEGQRATVERPDVAVPRGDAEDQDPPRDHLRWSFALRWERPPRGLRVRLTRPTAHALTVYAVRAEGASTPGVLTLLGEGETRRMDPSAPEVLLLRNQAPSPAASRPPVSPPLVSPPLVSPPPGSLPLAPRALALGLFGALVLAAQALVTPRRPLK